MKLVFLKLLLLISFGISGQEIAGRWYSKDSTRIYHIYRVDNQFEAILEKSSRKNDKVGNIILRHVISWHENKKFEGEICAMDGTSTFAKMRFEENGQVLRLRLRRMFFMNTTIKWYKVEEKTAAQLFMNSD